MRPIFDRDVDINASLCASHGALVGIGLTRLSLHNNSAHRDDIQTAFALVTMTTPSRFDTPILVLATELNAPHGRDSQCYWVDLAQGQNDSSRSKESSHQRIIDNRVLIDSCDFPR